MQATRLRHTLGGATASMPSAHPAAAASTALKTMTALRQVMGKTTQVRALDAVIAEARTILEANAAEQGDTRATRPEQVAPSLRTDVGAHHLR